MLAEPSSAATREVHLTFAISSGNPKSQGPNPKQSSKSSPLLRIWVLDIVWSLGFGAWNFRNPRGCGLLNILCARASKIAES
jgi:hypothetical protein